MLWCGGTKGVDGRPSPTTTTQDPMGRSLGPLVLLPSADIKLRRAEIETLRELTAALKAQSLENRYNAR